MNPEAQVQSVQAKPKQIIFVKELIHGIKSGAIKVTYRKTRKSGKYCVFENRFKRSESSLFIEFYRHEKVDPYLLTDDAAKLAGVNDAETIRKMFEKWYGSPIPALYGNWFRLADE